MVSAKAASHQLNNCQTFAARPGLYDEPFRGQVRFSPGRNWINDPTGLVYYRGEYHLFYQYNPFGKTWGNMSWGHAVSRDLLHWRELPVALRPDRLGCIFSGSAVVDEKDTSGFFGGGEGLVAIYTNAGGKDFSRQAQSIAYSRDRGRTWTKYEGNPVLTNPGARDFRDPKVFWHAPAGRWLMVLAAGDRVVFYDSGNLKDWNKLSEFGADSGAHGGVWECPDFFELPVGVSGVRKWVLQVDIYPGEVCGARYFVGDFDGERFVSDNPPDEVLWVELGEDFYAAQSWNNIPESDGRRVWIAWMNNWRYAGEIPTDPGRGCMTLPREVTLVNTADGVRLAQKPIRELKSLRRPGYQRKNIVVSEQGPAWDREPPPVDGRNVEIIADFDASSAGEFGFKARQGVGQQTIIGYDVGAGKLFVDRRGSGITGFSKDFPGKHEAPMRRPKGQVKMRMFVDRSSVEVFAGGGKTVITDLIFPRGKSERFVPYAKGGRTLLKSLRVHELESVWP